MLNEKKLQDHILSMEAAAKLMLSEASKIRSMIEIKKKPVPVDLTEINFHKRRMRSIKKACANRLSNKILNH